MATTAQVSAAFHECLHRALDLVTKNFEEHGDDMAEVFLRDGCLDVSLPLCVKFDQAGRLELTVGCNYVQSSVKDKQAALITPGQEQLPGVGGKTKKGGA